MIEKQVNKLYETRRPYDSYENEQFQEWLLQEDTQATPDQQLVIKHRYDWGQCIFHGHIVDPRKL